MYLTALLAKKSVLDVLFVCKPTSVKTYTEVGAGDIAAIVGLKGTTTGQHLVTITDPIVSRKHHFPRATSFYRY
jgi:translation elongation factor EF-G